MDMARDSISASEPVWFGCEVSKRWLFKDLKIDLSWQAFSRYVAKQGFLDLTAHDYQLVFGVEVNFQCSFLWPPISSCLNTRFKLGWTRRPGWCLGIAWWPMPWSSLGAMWRVALSPGQSIHGIPQSCPSFPFHQTLHVQGKPCIERIPSHWINVSVPDGGLKTAGVRTEARKDTFSWHRTGSRLVRYFLLEYNQLHFRSLCLKLWLTRSWCQRRFLRRVRR